jgi:hypothetical protein
MPLSSSSVDRRILEALSTFRERDLAVAAMKVHTIRAA